MNIGYWVLGIQYWVLSIGYWVLGIGIDDSEDIATPFDESDEPDIPAQASGESTETLSYFQKLANEEY